MIKTRTWIISFLVILIVCAALSMILLTGKGDTTVANVYRDGNCIFSVDLSRISEEYEFTVEDENGYNTIRIEPGRICVIAADCQDATCIHMGWLSGGTAPIVCLPHRLVIRLEHTAVETMGGFDGVAR